MSIRTIGNGPGQAATPAAAETGPPAKVPPPATTSVQAAKPEATSEQLKAAISEIQKSVEAATQNLQFSVDTETGKTIVSIIDKDSGELIRQIPSVELLEIAKSVGRMQGLLLNSKA